MLDNSIVMHGEVVYVEGREGVQYSDDAGGLRIKVRLDSDKNDVSDAELPYAFPLLPKTFQSVPQVGEGVFVLTAKNSRNDSQRYYIGPIISQPQYQEYCKYNKGKGNAVSLISEAKPLKELPLTTLSRAQGLTKGAFPEPNDVSIIGRGQEDIVLRYRGNSNLGPTSEINLRSGVRLKPSDASIKYLQGNVVFNNTNPSYIQIKYTANGLSGINKGVGDNDSSKYESTTVREGKSVVNVVADKINLISHKDVTHFGDSITNRDTLVDEQEIDNIMSQLHRAVYGDELIKLLKLIVKILQTHTHPYSMLPPTAGGTEMMDLVGYDFEKLISPNVRIS